MYRRCNIYIIGPIILGHPFQNKVKKGTTEISAFIQLMLSSSLHSVDLNILIEVISTKTGPHVQHVRRIAHILS